MLGNEITKPIKVEYKMRLAKLEGVPGFLLNGANEALYGAKERADGMDRMHTSVSLPDNSSVQAGHPVCTDHSSYSGSTLVP